MKPIGSIKERKPKKHYYILLNGRYVGESWAVSSAKAINNFWWKFAKEENELNPRDYDPEDFDAIEVNA